MSVADVMEGADFSYEDLAAMPPRTMGMGLALSWQAAQDPDAPALTMGDRTWTRGEVDRAANRLAREFQSRGVGKGDKIAVVLPTGPAHQIACFAIWKVGGTVVPISNRLVERELRHLSAEAKPRLLIGPDPADFPELDVMPQGFEPDPALGDEPLPETVSPMWKASCSGGSTGLPKIIWEHRPSLVHPLEPYPILRLQPGDVMFHPAAAYHNASFTQTNGGLMWGCHVILMDRFDPAEWLRIVEQRKVVWAYMVPTMMGRVLTLPEDQRRAADVSSLRMVIHMAAPCPAWVKSAWIDWLGPETIWEVYGGTEGYGATIINGAEWLAHPGSVGRASEGTTIRNDDGALLPAGEVGTIYFVPPPSNPMGHSLEPKTYGDMGSLDKDGYLYLADRRTDMILTGGVNLYPAEIEGVIEQWPQVAACAVIALPDPDLGSKAHAIVQLEAGAGELDVAGLGAFLGENLSSNKIPYTVEITPEALRDEAGKLRRKRLREERAQALPGMFTALRPARKA